ncbi:palmdelphin [Anarhichas minor]|uniref:palmdelphin n=1 Tax=Anarhichas minor TaxID=65739 RepID=UPI003F736C70
MEEANLLRERLQAITDKRRLQENIAKKRRQIEEEKLNLQYIKKKALREQWLMDGLSQQSEEEQEATRLQAQDEQQQSDQLQINILRIEEEIEALETQELNISANEEVVLKRLKEVERTAEDIIKELNADFLADEIHHAHPPLPDIPSFISLTPTKNPPLPVSEEPKKATFAMEISVEHDKRTGKSQVVSTATITPETIQERGLKVYDDGRKSVYALHQDRGKMHNGAVGTMTPTEVEELLHQATEKNVPTEVQYHQPVYSLSYTGSSRPSTPRTPRQTPTPSPFQSSVSSRNGAQILREESQGSQDLETWKTTSKSPSPSLIQQDSMSRIQRLREETEWPYPHIPGQSKSDSHGISQPHFGAKTLRGLTNRKMDSGSPNPAALVSVKARSEGIPAPKQPFYTGIDGCSPSPASHEPGVDPDVLTESSGVVNRDSPFCAESIASLNLINTLPEELESEPVTMIFMGYENAEDEDEDNIQAELVIISGDDDEDDEAHYGHNKSGREAYLSYHPEGYKSKVFQPKVSIAKVACCRDVIEDTNTNRDDLLLHKPTFTHNPERPSPYLQGQRVDESANTGSINMEEMKLCSTGR